MAEPSQRVRVEQLQWQSVFPFLRAFGAFRTALGFSNLAAAIALIVSMWALGQVMDAVWGPRVYPQEITQYAHLPTESFQQWRQAAAQSGRNADNLFDTLLEYKTQTVQGLIDAVAAGRLGFDHLFDPSMANPTSVVGIVRNTLVVLPGWLWAGHRWYILILAFTALSIWAVLGGAIARSAALHASQNKRIGLIGSLRYALSQWFQYMLTPVVPVLVIGLLVLVPMIHGAVFFNLPVVNIIGGLTLFVPIVVGAFITILIVLRLTAGPMLYPALAVEHTDCFDAMSRTFGYVLGRPLRWLWYSCVMWVYGVVAYHLVDLFIYLVIKTTRFGTDLLLYRDSTGSINSIDALVNPARPGQIVGRYSSGMIDAPEALAVALVSVWGHILMLLPAAFAISFFVSANTWIYLLLRRSVDGTELDDLFVEVEKAPTPVEPPQSDPG